MKEDEMSEKYKKALRLAAVMGCGFEGDAEDAAELLTLITGLETRIAELREDNASLGDSNAWLKQNYEDLERDYGVMYEKMCARIDKLKGALEDWTNNGWAEDYKARIAELEEKQRWRVVADGELPEVYRDEDGDFIPFLVCEGDGGNPFIAMYNGINWWAGIFVPDITHWMPLPEPPIVYGKVCEE